jgi:hypothetical protein
LTERNLLEHIIALENKNKVERGKELLSRLQALGIEPQKQEWRFPQITNFIVDFSPVPNKRHLMFSAHYDAVKNSPGANDNASSVAVLLGLCNELRNTRVPVKVVFFDREEAWLRTPFIKLGLLGSLYYVLRNDLSNIAAVYNLEFCGLGDSLAIWPIKDKQKDIPAIEIAEKAAAELNINFNIAYLPSLLHSSDHLSFRLRGVANSLTLSLLPSDQLPMLEHFVSNLNVLALLLGDRPNMPGVLSNIHKPTDDSSRLSENSLRLMLSLLMQIIHNYTL